MGNLMYSNVLLAFGYCGNNKGDFSRSLWREGRYEEAQKASDDAKKFSLWGAIATVICVVIYFVLYFGFFALMIAAEM